MADKFKINPFTSKLDNTGEVGLKLDQTTPQTVINGTPQFNEGIIVKEDKWINLDGL